MQKQRCTFTFYKFLSMILILVLSLSTVISLTPDNINTVEAIGIDNYNIESEPLVAPLDLETLNKGLNLETLNEDLLNNNHLLLTKMKITNDTAKQSVEDNISKIEESNIENIKQEKPVVQTQQEAPEIVEEPVKEVTSAQIAGTFTEYEIYEWAKIVYCEAGGESQKCKEYVAQVILNRINSNKFPNTVHGVIFQGKQFSPTFDGSWERKEPNQACYDAVYTVLNSPTALTNALFFEACRGSSWHSRNLTEVAAVDNTRFYTY